jgi:hypothetical protein
MAVMSAARLLLPRKRKSIRDLVMSQMCQLQTCDIHNGLGRVWRVRSVSRHHRKEHENGKDDQMYDALKHRGPASAQGDDAQQES